MKSKKIITLACVSVLTSIAIMLLLKNPKVNLKKEEVIANSITSSLGKNVSIQAHATEKTSQDDHATIYGLWSVNDVRENPAAVLAQLREKFSGSELLSHILGVGVVLKKYGTMDDLHNFMSITDNPGATHSMSMLLAEMANSPADAKKLISYSETWKNQAEGQNIMRVLLRKAGGLMGISALDYLSSTSGNLSSVEVSATLSGILKGNPAEVMEFVFSNKNNVLNKNDRIGLINELSQSIPMADLLEQIAISSHGDSASSSAYLNAAAEGASINLTHPETTIKAVISADGFTTSEKAEAIQSLAFSWSNTDVVAAAEWVNSLQAGVVRDRAILGILNGVENRRLDMPEAELWANSISDEQLRKSALESYLISKESMKNE